MSLPDISIRKPVLAWMLFWGILLFGFLSFRNLGISQMPDVDFPMINLQFLLPGASPEVIESNIVDIVEDSLLSVEGVVQITSASGYGMANITIELELNRDVDSALQEAQTVIAQIRPLLPTSLEPPIVRKYNPEDTPILWVAATYTGETRDLMVYIRDTLKSQISSVQGVSQILLGGFADRNLRIWIDEKKLSSYELTVSDLINTVKQEHREEPAGLLETKNYQKGLRSMGEVNTIRSFGLLRIPSRGGVPILGKNIYLKDVAQVEDGLDDIRRISRLNGKIAVGLGVLKQRGTNAVEVAKAVKRKVEELRPMLPPGFDLQVSFDSTVFIEESIGELEFSLVLSVLLTSIVCFLFLGSWSSTWNILLAIPTSIVGSFVVINFFGFTLNTFTLLALSLAIGIVIDDAIMILENIMRYKEEGDDSYTAASKGANEISFAALASTLSIVAIFLPVVFMKGVTGKYFFQFGVTISAAVILSLVEALTLTPMRASKYLHQNREGKGGFQWMENFLNYSDLIYTRLLQICLRHRWKLIFFSILLFSLSILFLVPLKKEFVPSMDQSRLLVRLQGPTNSSIYSMDVIAKKCEDKILTLQEVNLVYSAIGGFQGGQPSQSNFFVTLKDKDKRQLRNGKRLSQNEISSLVKKELQTILDKTYRVSIQDLSTRGFSSSRGYPVELSIQGPEWDTLISIAEELREKMKQSKNFTDVDSSYQEGAAEILIFPNREKASQMGVSVFAIGEAIEAMIGGVKVGQFTEGGHRYDIRLRLKQEQREKAEQIKTLKVRNQKGEVIPLSQLVNFSEHTALPSITRRNRQRAITVYANPSTEVGQKMAIEEATLLAKKLLKPGYIVQPTGSSEALSRSFESLYLALFLGVIVAYMILASQFNSFIQPIIVLIALPFSFSGAIVGLYIFGYSLNIYSFIALLLLMGLVKKNSIMLVDFTNHWIEKGFATDEAILKAAPIRLRPILMTSFSTIAAAIPPAFAIGPGSESRIPMSIAVIGGMLISTLLTLLVVPALYSLVYSASKVKVEKDIGSFER
jgi:hydrophobe/amphiphile efflux-1 (HAE1) family protein